MHEEKVDWYLLRGLGREAGHWGDFPAALERALPGSRVHFIELPGSGRRFSETSPAAVPAMVEAVRPSLQSGSGKKFLVAISLGAMIAAEWLSRYPGDVAGAVLVNASFRGTVPLTHRMSFTAIRGIASLLLTSDVAEQERTILRLTSVGQPHGERVAERVRLRKAHPLSRANFLRQLFAAARYGMPRQKPAAPVLLVTSLGDKFVHPGCSDVIASAWDAPLRRHPWAGHDLPLDDPEWLAKTVVSWVEPT